jgi:hypothetical protein
MSHPRRNIRPRRFARRTAHIAQACGAVAILIVGTFAMAGPAAASPDSHAPSSGGEFDNQLTFNNTAYSTISVTIDGTTVPVRWFKEVCYVARPQLVASTQTGFMGPVTIANPQCGYQSMNIYVPERSFNNQSTAIYFALNNAGWLASYVGTSVQDGQSYSSATSNVGAALKAGYVFVDVGNRDRNLTAADGSHAGKSPDAIVDAKAAVRYLRLNDERMPGSAERIVVNGTSGGGALASILGASGNSPDYYPYLKQAGAAGITSSGRSTLRDDVFAINAYAPITDLGNADTSYEWLYNTLGTRAAVAGDNPNPTASGLMAAQFPTYEKSLGLSAANGQRLTADTMIDAIKAQVIKSAEIYMSAAPANVIPELGQPMTYTSGGPPGQPPVTGSYINDWINVDNARNKVISVNMTNYLKFVATQNTLKGVPAFDAWGLSGVNPGLTESTLFGSSSVPYSNYTEYTWDHNDVAGDGSGIDDTGLTWAQYIKKPSTSLGDQIRLIDPMDYVNTRATTAPNWYLRVGTRDRDTAFTVALNLDRALAADRSVNNVDYQLAWNQPHAGNYDVPEAMKWIATTLAHAGASRH